MPSSHCETFKLSLQGRNTRVHAHFDQDLNDTFQSYILINPLNVNQGELRRLQKTYPWVESHGKCTDEYGRLIVATDWEYVSADDFEEDPHYMEFSDFIYMTDGDGYEWRVLNSGRPRCCPGEKAEVSAIDCVEVRVDVNLQRIVMVNFIPVFEEDPPRRKRALPQRGPMCFARH